MVAVSPVLRYFGSDLVLPRHEYKKACFQEKYIKTAPIISLISATPKCLLFVDRSLANTWMMLLYAGARIRVFDIKQ